LWRMNFAARLSALSRSRRTSKGTRPVRLCSSPVVRPWLIVALAVALFVAWGLS
jgi:hypothetical protein